MINNVRANGPGGHDGMLLGGATFDPALVGCTAQFGVGELISLVQDFESAVVVVLSWRLLLVISGGAVALSILGALVASTLSAFREHVTVLQDW